MQSHLRFRKHLPTLWLHLVCCICHLASCLMYPCRLVSRSVQITPCFFLLSKWQKSCRLHRKIADRRGLWPRKWAHLINSWGWWNEPDLSLWFLGSPDIGYYEIYCQTIICIANLEKMKFSFLISIKMTGKSLISIHFCSKTYLFELIASPKTIIYALGI